MSCNLMFRQIVLGILPFTINLTNSAHQPKKSSVNQLPSHFWQKSPLTMPSQLDAGNPPLNGVLWSSTPLRLHPPQVALLTKSAANPGASNVTKKKTSPTGS